MASFGHYIRPQVDAELDAASEASQTQDWRLAFTHLERAHILGQASTVQHVKVHLRMLAWGWHRRSVWECVGQVLRIAGAISKTGLGLVPVGNTGGANVSPFKRMPVAADLASRIEAAWAQARS